MRKITWESVNLNFNEYNKSFEEIPEEISDIPGFNEMEYEEPTQYFNTPFGLFEIADPFSPLKRVELRLGYTNFPITKMVAKTINDCDGVDALRVISRYSFIIGIGRMFNFTEVRQNLENLLECNEEHDLEIEDLIGTLGNKRYAILIFPNGNYEYITSEMPNFNSILVDFELIKEKTNSTLIKSPN